MLNRMFQHWKTTLAGAGLAALQVAAGAANWKAIALAVATAFLGALAKDN